MARGARLRFRRHLALLVLLWTLHELTARRPPQDSLLVKAHEDHHQQDREIVLDEDQEELLARLQRLLPAIRLNLTLWPWPRHFRHRELDEEVARYFRQEEPTVVATNSQQADPVERLELAAVKAAIRVAPMPIHNSWAYHSAADLAASAWPVHQPQECASHLRQLESRLDASGDLQVARLLDTFGRAPSDLLRGNIKWLGSPRGCRLARVATSNTTTTIRFRYCLAALRARSWQPEMNQTRRSDRGEWIPYGVSTADLNLELFFFRLGVCLPESCRSDDLEPNRPQLERLARARLAQPYNQVERYQLAELYCQPDDRSPLRRIPLGGRLLLIGSALWLLCILWATSVQLSVERLYWREVRQLRRSAGGSEAEADVDVENTEADLCGLRRRWLELNMWLWDHASLRRPIECLSLYANWQRYTRRLRTTVSERLEEERRRERLVAARKQQLEIAEVELIGAKEGEELEARVDTSPLDALKVVGLFWVILGHCALYLGSAIADPDTVKLYMHQPLAYLIAGGTVYITEIFFLITGCLTSYLSFKSASSSSSSQEDASGVHLSGRLLHLSHWLALAFGRYVRLVPSYLLVYAYVKWVSLYAGGSGPTWDYAVSSNSLRRRCQQESWWPLLTLTTNLAHLTHDHCIVGGWYLATDFQFALAGAPLLLLLARSMVVASKTTPHSIPMTPGGRPASSSTEPPKAQEGNRVVASWGRLARAHSLLALCALLSLASSVLWAMARLELDLSLVTSLLPHVPAALSAGLALYTNPLFRFRTYALGLGLGQLLYLYEFRLVRVPRALERHGAKLATALFLAGSILMCLPALWPADKLVLSHDVAALLGPSLAMGLDLFLGALVLLLCTGKAPRAALFLLRAPLWSPLASLSLGAFLWHAELVVLLTSQLQPPPSASYALLLLVFAASLLGAYSLALLHHLCLELPLARLLETPLKRHLGLQAGRRFLSSENEAGKQ